MPLINELKEFWPLEWAETEGLQGDREHVRAPLVFPLPFDWAHQVPEGRLGALLRSEVVVYRTQEGYECAITICNYSINKHNRRDFRLALKEAAREWDHFIGEAQEMISWLAQKMIE